MSTAASLRQELSELADVTRAWFEWEFEDGHWVKTLVVEVTFDTDPASPEFKRSTLCDVEMMAADVLARSTTSGIRHLRIVPRSKA
jgi:hypothetical protein